MKPPKARWADEDSPSEHVIVVTAGNTVRRYWHERCYNEERGNEMETYFHRAFRTQLESLNYSEPNRVLRQARDLEDTVFFGGEDWHNVEQDLARVPASDRKRFVLCLFMVVLNDQAFHACRPDLYQLWREQTAYPKFGWAGFGAHFENPFKLLSIPEQKGLVDVMELVAAMPAFVHFYMAATKAQLAAVDSSLSLRDHIEGIVRDHAYAVSEGKAVAAFKAALDEALASHPAVFSQGSQRMKHARRSSAPQLHYYIDDYEDQALRDRLERDLERILVWQFPVLGQGCHDPKGLAISLVDGHEFERHVPHSPRSVDSQRGGFDALGIYVTGAPVPGECGSRAQILISPKKIMKEARDLHGRALRSMPLEEVHKTLIAAVAVHELAHAMMDGQTGPLQAAADNWFDPCASRDGFLFEESLAEAFVLVQHFGDDERHVVATFMQTAPPAYRAGSSWHASASSAPNALMTTMRAWRNHKALDSGLLTRVPELFSHLHSLQSVANELRDGRAPALPFDFRKAFFADVERAFSTGLINKAANLVGDHLKYRYADQPHAATPLPVCSAQVGAMLDDEKIRGWLEQHGIRRFRIEGSTVHVDGDVDISGWGLERIPVKFGRVDGHFDCSGNRLRSLCDLPKVVIGHVYCCHNPISALSGFSTMNRVIAGYLCLNGNKEKISDLLPAVQVDGLQLVVAPVDGVNIVNGFLGRPDDIFECQAKLIENRFENLAKNDPHCERCQLATVR